jgi:hypothetical protein
MVADSDDSLCIVKIYKAYKKHFPEDYNGPFLRQPKPDKEVQNERTRANNKVGQANEFIMMADLTTKGKFGKNYPSKICNENAEMVGLEDSRGKIDCCMCILC